MSKLKTSLPFKWILPLVILTTLGLTQSYGFAMMGLTTFMLAYLSKGIRRKKRASLDVSVQNSGIYKDYNAKL